MNAENLAAFNHLCQSAQTLAEVLGPELDALDDGHNYNVLSLMYLMRAVAHAAEVFAADNPDRPLKDAILVLEAVLRQIREDIGYTPLSKYCDSVTLTPIDEEA